MKNNEEKLLDNLFSDARQQPANLSFEDISNQFTQSVNGNVSTQLTKKWYSKLFNLNTIIIMLSTLLISGFVLFTISEPPKTKIVRNDVKKAFLFQKNQVKTENNQNFDTSSSVVLTEELEQLIKHNQQQTFMPDFYSTYPNLPSVELVKTDSNKISNQNNKSFEIVSSKKKSPTNDSIRLISYTINEKTTKAELDEIKRKAESCGMEYKYNVKIKRGYIKSLRITMMLTNAKGGKSKSQYYCNGSKKAKFEYIIKWNVNKKGKAIDFDGNGCAVNINAPELPKQ